MKKTQVLVAVLTAALAAVTFAGTLVPQRVLELTKGHDNPRNSEGDFVKLKDGRILFIYSHYTGTNGDDHGSAFLASRESSDGGLTWSANDVKVVENEGGMNVMSVSLLRLRDGRIALFYLVKNSFQDCRPVVRFSSDEAKTWTAPVKCVSDERIGYYVLNNARVIQTSSGRLVLPLSWFDWVKQPNGKMGWDFRGELVTALSDDGGATWRMGRHQFKTFGQGKSDRITTQEPGVIELKDGRLLMWIRTSEGVQYVCHSSDEGETWTSAVPWNLIAPCAPATVKRLSNGDLLAVWNDHGAHPEWKNVPWGPSWSYGNRAPLTVAISKDEGRTWVNRRDLETDLHGWFCYIAAMEEGDNVLLGYCARDNLATSRVTVVPKAWLYGPARTDDLTGFFTAGEPASYVDPFVGTKGNGHVFPAACVPFGLVQAGADTGVGDWPHTGGYQYDDPTILGFSQTHISGTGCPGLGDVRLLPFVGSASKDLKSAYRKATEKAEPGWYAVTLDDFKVDAEVSALEHAAIYRFTYRGTDKARMLADFSFGIGNAGRKWGSVFNLANRTTLGADRRTISGKARRRIWVEREVSYHIAFDRPWCAAEELPREGDDPSPVYALTFDLKQGETLTVKVGLSSTAPEAARANLEKEIPHWDLNRVRRQARDRWNVCLNRVELDDSADEDAKRNFYTALYRLCIHPNNLSDCGARPFYSTFSLWDTFRAAHPLFTILHSERIDDFIDSMLVQGERTGYLPIWTLWGVENQCMIGTHSVPVIVDWFLKTGGKGPTDWNRAYAAIKDSLTVRHANRMKERWDLLDKHGYYPYDEITGESVSRTLECAYDDACAARLAAALGKGDDAAFFTRRAANWRNCYDPSIGYMRGKDSNGKWREPFSVFQLGHGSGTANDFTEGNSLQYTWHVMHDPHGLIETMGGADKFAEKLDGLFKQPSTVQGAGFVLDVSGLIGQYAHGNEPSHHVAYFYPFVGRAERTAEVVREVFDRFYQPKPDGLCGNDDCGQMSAWYVFSALGFYPFDPCGGDYVLGAPQIPGATLSLPDGRTFRVVAKGLSKENKYVASVTLNGKALDGFVLKHAEVMAGGELVFTMASRPAAKK